MFSFKSRIVTACLALSLVGAVACSEKDKDDPAPTVQGSDSQVKDKDDPAPAAKNLVDLVISDARFSTLKTALVTADLVDTLKNGEFTVFAPTNEAFAKLGQDTLNAVLADKKLLTSILLYHVVPGTVKAERVLASATLTSASQGILTPSLQDGAAFINGSKILQTDIIAENGVIHVIDTVLLPPTN